YLDFDTEARNYSAEWKVLPVSIEISNVGVRRSVGKPLPQGSPANIDKVHVGMVEREVQDLLGSPRSIASHAGRPATSLPEVKTWRYGDAQSHCLPPAAFVASVTGIAGNPPSTILALLVNLNARIAGYDIEFLDGKVVRKTIFLMP